MSTTSRRAVLAGAAALTAAPVAALAATLPSEPDPIFAAIERYNRANAYVSECTERADALEAPVLKERLEYYRLVKEMPDDDEAMTGMRTLLQTRKPDITPDEVRQAFKAYYQERMEKRDPEIDRLRAAGAGVENEAFEALMDVVPTTIAGVSALASALFLSLTGNGIDGLIATSMENDGEDGKRILRNIATALQRLSATA